LTTSGVHVLDELDHPDAWDRHPMHSLPRAGEYESFVAAKLQIAQPVGMETIPDLHPSLFPHQRALVEWALRRGRGAIFADTGLGKTAIQLEWARHVVEFTGQPAIILAPLAVAAQTVREGERMGIVVTECRDGADVRDGVNIANYERLHRFDPARFGAVVLDESSIIKHHDAKTLGLLLDAFRHTPWKLCATATPAPNDYTELGTHAEFLGICSRAEMLSEFFTHDGGETQTWRLKGPRPRRLLAMGGRMGSTRSAAVRSRVRRFRLRATAVSVRNNASMTRQGIPDYLITMRDPRDVEDRVTHDADLYPVSLWQNVASPVWMDINPSDTLQYRSAREHEDERHIAPLQLEVIRRAVRLWTNPGDVVLSPFAGIGSEGYVALEEGRRFVGAELKASYWRQACANLAAAAHTSQPELFTA